MKDRRQTQGWPNRLGVGKRAGTSIVAVKAREMVGPTPGMLINRRHTSSSRLIESTFRCSFVACSRSFERALSKDAMISASSGMPSTNSRIRSSNFTTPTTPTLSSKLRKRPRISFDIDCLFLQQHTCRQQRPPLLARQRFGLKRNKSNCDFKGRHLRLS